MAELGSLLAIEQDRQAVLSLREELKRWSYKPGWELRIEPDPSPWITAVLFIHYEAADSRNPSRTIPIQARHPINPYLAENLDEFARWLQHALFSAERHESQEWLRRDGAIYDDPHQTRRQ